MCGIHAAISPSPNYGISNDLERCLCNRGPDHTGSVQTHVPVGDGQRSSLFLTFTSTVLSLRGDHVAKQPLVDESSGSVLCWNGEAWRIRGELVRGNDGEAVLALLTEASRKTEDGDAVLEALCAIEGPFSFIYFDKSARRLYYGRDRLGRRSLLVNPGSPFSLSSITEKPVDGCSEVEADGCYTLQLDQGDIAAGLVATRHDWACDTALVSSIGVFNASIPEDSFKLSQGSRPVQDLRQHLVESLRLRVMDVPMPPQASATDARLAVLFSGGLDCTVLARLAHDILPLDQSIDLINVAFENPRIGAQNPDCSKDKLYEKCPDRLTGRSSFAELMSICRNRSWRFVTVNVPYTETIEHRVEVIRLIHPHNTEMDLSIACALYFAARGQGRSQSEPDAEPHPYGTTARVLLSGLGADELFGGYVRHATAYNRRGYHGLVEELKLDVSRLGKRNLGRDDRVMAHWGREVRFPYLDERFVKWAIESPVWEKCDFANKGDDIVLDPEKRVLRLLAKDLGMDAVAREKKRAIQFGARTAKMESGKVKGTTLITA
ncbi:Fc.00g064770.m01.CDS01 [Cosmosporella sp. VM-42]